MKLVTKNKAENHKEEQNINAHTFTNVGDIIDFTNDNLGENMYIGERRPFIPEKKDIWRIYWTDFILKTKKEAKKIMEKEWLHIAVDKDIDFYVYNERANEIVPFKKNDFMMFDHGEGYLTFDGKSYIYYDDNGYEKGRNTYGNDQEIHINNTESHI